MSESLEKSPPDVFEELPLENLEDSDESSGEEVIEDSMVEKEEPEKHSTSHRSSRIELIQTPEPSEATKRKPRRRSTGKKATKKSPRREITPPKSPKLPKASPKKPLETATQKPQETATQKPQKTATQKIQKTAPQKPQKTATWRKPPPKGPLLPPRDDPLMGSISSRMSILSASSISSRLSRRSNKSVRISRRSKWDYTFLKSKPKKSQPTPALVRSKSKEFPLRRGRSRSIESLQDKGLDSDSETDTQANVVETEETIQEVGLAQRLAFMHLLRELPDIQDLSETTTIEELFPEEEEGTEGPVADDQVDTGRFVESFDSSQSLDTDTDQTQGQPSPEHETLDEWDATDLSTDISDLSIEGLSETLSDEIDFEEPVFREDSVNDIFKEMASIVQTVKEVEFVAEIVDDFSEACEELLAELINRAVDHAESDSEGPQKQSLDKAKMLDQLDELIDDYQIELHYNTELDRTITEMHLRRRRMGFISESKVDSFSLARYRHALSELDHHLNVESQIKQTKEETISRLRDEEKAARMEADEKVQHFEDKVREVLCFRDEFEHLKKWVGELLLRISRFRNEVGEVRESLLLTQHTYADLNIQLDTMETVGDDLKIHEYMSKQAANQSLSIKIDERSAELKRLHTRITHDIHALAHSKNKEQMSQHIFSLMRRKLKKMMDRRDDLRVTVYKGKIRSNNLKKEVKNMCAAGCLMHYPGLMRDYDTTVDQLEVKRNVVQKLRLEHGRLEHRVRHLLGSIAEQEEKQRNSRHLSSLKL